jgi:cytidine deaminase
MQKQEAELIAAATAIINARHRPKWHAVGAALRLRGGQIVTAVNMDAYVGRIGVCAEAVALGRAVAEYGATEVEAIVAVYRRGDGVVDVVAPCGMCREMLCDYAPNAVVLVPDGKAVVARPVRDLLPSKYSRDML